MIKKVWRLIKRLWSKLDNTLEKHIDMAITIVEVLKKVMDSPIDDIIFEIVKRLIPGTADDIVIDKLKQRIESSLPKMLRKLVIAKDISLIDDPNEQVKEILANIHFEDEQSKAAFYHSLASMLAEDLSDGKLSWSEAVVLSEFIYNKKFK